jgi:hypothetical protein
MQNEKLPLAFSLSKPDWPEKTRCHSAPAKSVSTIDGMFERCQEIPQYMEHWHTSMEGDEIRRHYPTDNPRRPPPEIKTENPASTEPLAATSRSYPSRKSGLFFLPKPKKSSEKIDIPNRVFVGGLTPEVSDLW